ncbi:MAG TPA: RICIN domain-containing protein, partial [Chthoniobacterales bacterium]
NAAEGRVLDVDGSSTANGVTIWLWDWLSGNNQKWTITPAGDGYFKLTAVHSGKVADVEGPSTADGAIVHQWADVGVLNQHWSFTLAP